MFYVFCCDDTPATEIDTSLHTLALHDARPCWGRHRLLRRHLLVEVVRDQVHHRFRIGLGLELVAGGFQLAAEPLEVLDDAVVHQGRSDEHTSELQSLMRISYAVFCLTKKQTYIYNQYQC